MPRLNRKPQGQSGQNCEYSSPALPFEFRSAHQELYLQSRLSDDPVTPKAFDLRPGNSDLGQQFLRVLPENRRRLHDASGRL